MDISHLNIYFISTLASTIPPSSTAYRLCNLHLTMTSVIGSLVLSEYKHINRQYQHNIHSRWLSIAYNIIRIVQLDGSCNQYTLFSVGISIIKLQTFASRQIFWITFLLTCFCHSKFSIEDTGASWIIYLSFKSIHRICPGDWHRNAWYLLSLKGVSSLISVDFTPMGTICLLFYIFNCFCFLCHFWIIKTACEFQVLMIKDICICPTLNLTTSQIYTYMYLFIDIHKLWQSQQN